MDRTIIFKEWSTILENGLEDTVDLRPLFNILFAGPKEDLFFEISYTLASHPFFHKFVRPFAQKIVSACIEELPRQVALTPLIAKTLSSSILSIGSTQTVSDNFGVVSRKLTELAKSLYDEDHSAALDSQNLSAFTAVMRALARIIIAPVPVALVAHDQSSFKMPFMMNVYDLCVEVLRGDKSLYLCPAIELLTAHCIRFKKFSAMHFNDIMTLCVDLQKQGPRSQMVALNELIEVLVSQNGLYAFRGSPLFGQLLYNVARFAGCIGTDEYIDINQALVCHDNNPDAVYSDPFVQISSMNLIKTLVDSSIYALPSEFIDWVSRHITAMLYAYSPGFTFLTPSNIMPHYPPLTTATINIIKAVQQQHKEFHRRKAVSTRKVNPGKPVHEVSHVAIKPCSTKLALTFPFTTEAFPYLRESIIRLLTAIIENSSNPVTSCLIPHVSFVCSTLDTPASKYFKQRMNMISRPVSSGIFERRNLSTADPMKQVTVGVPVPVASEAPSAHEMVSDYDDAKMMPPTPPPEPSIRIAPKSNAFKAKSLNFEKIDISSTVEPVQEPLGSLPVTAAPSEEVDEELSLEFDAF